MNRIETIFSTLRAEGQKALMPFVTAGYPSLEATESILRALDQSGASICEIGIPFSDPIADGPTIQASMTDALDSGITVAGVMDMVKRIRPDLKLGLIAMVSYSIVYRYGLETFVTMAKDAGFDGFIFPDVPLQEAEAVNLVAKKYDMTSSLLIAPSTTDQRAKEIAEASSGFVYILARAGITGAREDLPEDLTARLQNLREITDLPLAVGFGISKPTHVNQVTRVADAAIVGSALVKRISEVKTQAPNQIGSVAGEFVRELLQGLK